MFVECSVLVAETFAGGQMAHLIRQHDWDGSSLGRQAAWPQQLQTTVDLMLSSQFPMFVAWGPQRCLVYNDAYSLILGKKHPEALGAPFHHVWNEIWDSVGPIADHAFAGQPSYCQDLPLPMERNGYPELTYFTFSYSGVRGPSGAIEGMFCVCLETTASVVGAQLRIDETDRLRQLFQQAPGFMATLRGPNHVFEMTNDAYRQVAGFRDLLGKPIREAMPELAGQGFFELLDRVYATGEPYVARGMPVKVQHAPDAPLADIFINFVYQPIIAAGGAVTGIFVEGSDVSEQHLAQQELAHHIERLEEAELRKTYQLELADRIRDLAEPEAITAAASEMLGRRLAVERVIYAEVSDDDETFVIAREWRRPGAASLAGSVRRLADFGPRLIAELRAGKTVAIDDVRADARTGEHGDAYAAVGVMANLGVPLVKSGRLVAVLNVHQGTAFHWTDTSIELAHETAERTWAALESARARAELKAERDQSQQAERALRDSEAKFRTITNAMPHMVFSALPDGSHDYFNEQWYAFTGVDESASVGQQWAQVFHPDDRVHARERWHRSLASGEPYELEFRLRHRSGQYRWVLARALPIRDEGGAIIRWMGSSTDIHDQKLTQEALRVADRRKDEFLAMLAHELRNPLAPISAGADLLRLTRVDEGRVRQISELISRQVKHMTSLVDDLMDVSRVTRGLVTLNNALLDARHIVTDAVEQVRPLIDACGHQLAVHTPPASAFVVGDQKRLIQVITNVLNNAAKYTPKGGSIVLRMEATPDEVVISVADNGIGMGPEMVGRVFELFAQAERTSDRSQGGLGIGLALVKSLVELHEGTVAASSGGADQGSEFTIRLPRAALPATAAEAAREDLLGATAKALRVLVVDDNHDAAMMLGMFLESAGHAVAIEHSGARGLERARAEQPDVCLLDIGLPDMDGNELARRLREQPGGAARTLVAITGYGQDEDRKQTAQAGFDHHFVKPVDAEALLTLLAGGKDA